ncbi:MAG: DUF4290 domain-containing protein [Cyclonatronaceae bacterium]
MFLKQRKPRDFDCGLNIDLMIEALPRIQDEQSRIEYGNRIVGLIKQSHINWVDDNGESKLAWDYYFELAGYDPEEFGVLHPYRHNLSDDAR